MLSKKTKYALKALLRLAQEEAGTPVLIASLARQETIPKRFLEAILLELKHQGIVRSKKGKGGGYLLAKGADQISVGHLIRILDGPLAPIPCVSQTAYARCEECADETTCGIRMLMKEVRDATAAILDSATLADLVRRAELAAALSRADSRCQSLTEQAHVKGPP